MNVDDTYPKPIVRRHSTAKQEREKIDFFFRLIWIWFCACDADDDATAFEIIVQFFISGEREGERSLPFYLFHFESLFRRFVVAAARLLEIFFIYFHFEHTKPLLPFNNRQTKWISLRKFFLLQSRSRQNCRFSLMYDYSVRCTHSDCAMPNRSIAKSVLVCLCVCGAQCWTQPLSAHKLFDSSADKWWTTFEPV